MLTHVVVPSRVRACIFDFDGVLVDSEPLHMHAIVQAAEPRGWTFTVAQFVEHIVGRGDERAFHSIASWHGQTLTEDELRELIGEKQRFMGLGIDERRFAVQPGAIDAIRGAADRFGDRIAVCSGSRASAVVPMLRAIGVASLFESTGVRSDSGKAHCTGERPHASRIVTQDDVTRPKPDPEGYLLAAARLGVTPGEAMAIEDTASGVAAAKAAGLFTVAVTHTLASEKLMEADVIVPRISDVWFAEMAIGSRG